MLAVVAVGGRRVEVVEEADAVHGGGACARPLGGSVVVDKVGTAEEDLLEIWPGRLGFALGLDDVSDDNERIARGGRTLSTFAAGPRGSCSVKRGSGGDGWSAAERRRRVGECRRCGCTWFGGN